MIRSEMETDIQNAGVAAARITPDQIEQQIAREDYHRFPGTNLTVCALILRNGYTVTGESACACDENFREALGRKFAREHAKNKILALEGYLLREKIWRRSEAPKEPALDEL